MAIGLKVSLFIALLCWYLGQSEGITCSSNQIRCRTGGQCISLSDVCRNGRQCSDGSDENTDICSFWTYDSRYCSRGYFHCSGSCKTIENFCSLPSCVSQKNNKLCKMVKAGRLGPENNDTGLALTEEMVTFLQQAVNASSPDETYSCPMLYNRIGDDCVSFFSLAKVPWAEARQFCLSIKGDLLSVDKVAYGKLLQYMKTAQLTTDYWTGGRYDMDTNAWSWVIDDKPMLLGTPYWALRYSSFCVPRAPPQTNPFSSPPEALEGAPCYHYLQAPAKRTQGMCAAMNYEHYYYFTDESCQESRSPLCIYVQQHYDKAESSTRQAQETKEEKSAH